MKSSLWPLTLVIVWEGFMTCMAKTHTNRANEPQTYQIKTTWDNHTVPEDEFVTITLSRATEEPTNEEQLVLTVEAKFYNDPVMNESAPNDTFWELWEHEVVELFLLGEGSNSSAPYLEIEIAPRGQYLLLELKGYRNVIRDKLPLYKGQYTHSINTATGRWTGRALIPNCYLPRKINRFNAFAIHGSGDNRVYMSLFPASQNPGHAADFHRLEYFQPLKWEHSSNNSGSKNLFALSSFFMVFGSLVLWKL